MSSLREDRASGVKLILVFVVSAMVYRFQAKSWRGPIRLCISVFDVLIYAVALSVVMESVFLLDSNDRFVPLLIGLIVLRWTLGSMIQASRVGYFVHICRPYFGYPIFATLILALGPPTIVFLISMILLGLVIAYTAQEPVDMLRMVAWGSSIALVQLLWNAVLVLSVIYARLRRIFTSEMPLLFGFMLLFIISPVAYQISDIPASASRILTSFNPAAHLIAAYQNAFWYLRDLSLEVLPFSALVAVILSFAAFILISRTSVKMTERNGAVPRVISWDGQGWTEIGTPKSFRDEHVYGIWPNELPWISGNEFLHLVEPARGRQNLSKQLLGELAGDLKGDLLLSTQLPIMSNENQSRICVAALLSKLHSGRKKPNNIIGLSNAPTPQIVFDGLLDYAEAPEIRAFSEICLTDSMQRFVILTYRSSVAQVLLGTALGNDAMPSAS